MLYKAFILRISNGNGIVSNLVTPAFFLKVEKIGFLPIFVSTCTSFLIRTGGPHSLLLCMKIRAGGACYIMCNVHTLYIRHYRYMMGLTYLLHELKPAYIVVRPPGLVHYLKSYT